MNTVREISALYESPIEVRELSHRSLIGPPSRFASAIVASLAVHLVVIAIFGFYFAISNVAPEHGDVIPVMIIGPVGGLAGGGGGRPIASHPDHPSTHHAPVRFASLVKPRSMHHESAAVKSIAKDDLNRSQPEVKDSATVVHPTSELSWKSAASPAAQEGIASASGGSGTGVGGGNGSGIGNGSGAGSGGGFGTGGSGPRAIYSPIPVIPDDLRDEVMQATAVARFEVSHNGTSKVTLLRTTDYSELDDIILDTLRKWRFLPAMKNGVAIDSEADVRLLISVK
jgi:TonB family protein